jgi:cardiolipin synthase
MYLASNNKKALFVEKYVTCATLITLVRLVLIVPIVYFIQSEKWTDAFGWFVGAALTDGIDGAVARSMNECTFFGAALDAFIDKIFIISITVALMCSRHFTCFIPFWFSCFVIVRECAQLIGCVAVYWYCGSIEIRPLFLGKCTMFLYLCLTSLVLYQAVCKKSDTSLLYLILLVFIVGSISFAQYCYIAYKSIKAQQKLSNRV